MAEEKSVEKKDYLVLELSVPVEHEGVTITRLNLSKLREMTGRDLNEIYDLCSNWRGPPSDAGGNAAVCADRGIQSKRISGRSNHGFESKGFRVSQKQGIPFFLSHGISCAADIQQLNQVYIAAGRYTKAGPQFFYDLPLRQALAMMSAAQEQAKQEKAERERQRRRR